MLKEIKIPDGKLLFDPAFLSESVANEYFESLRQEIAWRQEQIKLFGRIYDQPRLTAWYGDPGKVYTYSNLTWEPLPWTPLLQFLRQAVEAAAEHRFNSVLLNYYRQGQDSMGWHSDDEPELGPEPLIASLSLGASRSFHLRHRHQPRQHKLKLKLLSGSLLVMAGRTQANWQHQLPKTRKVLTGRINLTFRYIE